jgi:hypothetical protein
MEGWYPTDMLTLTLNNKYLQNVVPSITLPKNPTNPGHAAGNTVYQTTMGSMWNNDGAAGNWSYENVSADSTWGTILVNCSHKDLKGNVWTTY